MDLDTVNDLLECAICLERLDHSNKMLPCQHTFCRRCLERICGNAPEPRLLCPECRKLVVDPIIGLPSNIFVNRTLARVAWHYPLVRAVNLMPKYGQLTYSFMVARLGAAIDKLKNRTRHVFGLGAQRENRIRIANRNQIRHRRRHRRTHRN